MATPPLQFLGQNAPQPAMAGGLGLGDLLQYAPPLPEQNPVREAGFIDRAVKGVINAFHSSPHKFDKFEWSPRTARTGEGGAAYGEGLYHAENPAVSGRGGQYWQQFARRAPEGSPESHATGRLQLHGWDRDQATAAALRDVEDWRGPLGGRLADDPAYVARMRALREKEHELLSSGQHVGPYTYEVGIRARPEDLLDWDKPLSKQSPEVREKLDRRFYNQFDEHMPGSEIYRRAGQSMSIPDNPKLEATKELMRAGIPGHRFLDQGSRVFDPDAKAIIDAHGEKGALDLARERFKQADLGSIGYWDKMVKEIEKAANPTRNYVVWQPEILDILKRYGGVGAAPLAGLGALGASQQRSAPPEVY